MVKESVCFPYEFTLLSNRIGLNAGHTLVCFPYEFTLLSNTIAVILWSICVCFPYEFTLLSNALNAVSKMKGVCFHYEFTLLSNSTIKKKDDVQFVFPTNLHCSQTRVAFLINSSRFVFPTNLHCSQTSNRPRIIFCKIPVSLHRSYHSSLY